MHSVVYKHRTSIGKIQISIALSAVTVFIAMCRFSEQRNPYLTRTNFIQLHSQFSFRSSFYNPPLDGNEEALLALSRFNNCPLDDWIRARNSDALNSSRAAQAQHFLLAELGTRGLERISNGKEDGGAHEEGWFACDTTISPTSCILFPSICRMKGYGKKGGNDQ